MEEPSKKEIITYFRANLFEVISLYNAWKMISFSKSKGVLSEEMAQRYVEIQNYHPNFFLISERAFLISFVVMLFHSFDKRDDSMSLYKIEKEKTENFVEQNKEVIDSLKLIRHKVFAHKETSSKSQEFLINSIIEIDKFLENLIRFYNELSKEAEDSTTIFDNANDIRNDIECLFMNLYRGEAVRLKEIDMNWSWREPKDIKASDLV